MRILIFIPFFFNILFSTAQQISADDLREYSEKLNSQIQDIDLENGVEVIGCHSKGMTLIYEYSVPNDWYPENEIKSILISTLNNTKAGEFYSRFKIDVEYHYFKNRTLAYNVRINSGEFAPPAVVSPTINSQIPELGEYIYLKDHPKSKGVDLKMKTLKGWEIKEGNRPNIVKKYVSNFDVFLILIKDNSTFFSRNEAKDLFQDSDFVDELIQNDMSFLENLTVLSREVITVDTYPTLVFKVKGSTEKSGMKLNAVIKTWFIFYEDKFVMFQGNSPTETSFDRAELAFDRIINSVIFPEQYR